MKYYAIKRKKDGKFISGTDFDEKGNCRCPIGLMCVDGIKKWLEKETEK